MLDALRSARPSPLLGAALAALLALAAVALGADEVAGLTAWRWPLVVLAAIAGALLARTRVGRLLPALSLAALVLLAVVAYTPLAGALARPLVRRDPAPSAPVDAIVVLSAWLDGDGHLSGAALDRLLTGAELFRRGAAPRLVLSRVRHGTGPQALPSDADQDRVLALLGRRVPVSRVDSVHSTRDEAVRVARLGLRHVILVTSPTHTRRACATFEGVGLRVTCVPSEGRDLALRSLDAPDARVKAFRHWLYERLGAVEYRARGWIR